MKILSRVEESLKSALQREFILHNKQTGKSLRKGKFLLYTVKEFYMVLIFTNNKHEQKTYNMPLPYDIHHNDDGVEFDYTIETLCFDREDLIETVRLTGRSRSPFYDSIIEMSFV